MRRASHTLTDSTSPLARPGLFSGAADLIQHIAEDPARGRERALVVATGLAAALIGTLVTHWLIPAIVAARMAGGA